MWNKCFNHPEMKKKIDKRQTRYLLVKFLCPYISILEQANKVRYSSTFAASRDTTGKKWVTLAIVSFYNVRLYVKFVSFGETFFLKFKAYSTRKKVYEDEKTLGDYRQFDKESNESQ